MIEYYDDRPMTAAIEHATPTGGTIRYWAAGPVIAVAGRRVGDYDRPWPAERPAGQRTPTPRAGRPAPPSGPRTNPFLRLVDTVDPPPAEREGRAYGIAIHYNTRLPDNRGRPELFTPGAFRQCRGLEVPLLVDHDQDHVIGRATLGDNDTVLWWEAELYPGALARIGTRRECSIGLCPQVGLELHGVQRHYRADVWELSLVHVGAHHGHTPAVIEAA